MKAPEITKEHIVPLYETRFLNMYDLQYAPGKHYYAASRRKAEDMPAIKSDEDAGRMLPDAVSCVVILAPDGEEPRLLLNMEYRYPAGRFLLSIPAGLIDPEDKDAEEPLLETARREIREETGLRLTDEDTLEVISPFVYSTPGMTDESNALVCAVVHSAGEGLSQAGAMGSECFNGFEVITKEEALHFLRAGRDRSGQFYSVYTWAALTWFVSGLWE